MAEIRLDNITKRFNDKEVVKSLNLTIHQGELVCLLGESGCGKTTTLRMIAGLLAPNEGEIYIDGQPVSHLKSRERGAVMVFQDHRLFPHMTVFENIAFGLKVRRRDKKQIRNKVQWALDMVKLSGYEKRYPAELSGGQSQRIALARALVLEPKVLLLDEPLSNLDAVLRDDMRSLIKDLHHSLQLTIVFVTHDQKEAMMLADRIAIMEEGVIQQVAEPTDIYYRPTNQWVARFVGQANLLPARATDSKVQSLLGEWQLASLEREQWADQNFNQVPHLTSELVVMVRPEEIQIVDKKNGFDIVTGKIVDAIFTGESWSYQVQINDQIIVVNTAGKDRFFKDDLVGLKVDAKSICLFIKES